MHRLLNFNDVVPLIDLCVRCYVFCVRFSGIKTTLKLGLIVRYDTIAEFNVDLKAEYIQLNLAHVARN